MGAVLTYSLIVIRIHIYPQMRDAKVVLHHSLHPWNLESRDQSKSL